MTDFAATIPVNERVSAAVQAATTPPRQLSQAEIDAVNNAKLAFFEAVGDRMRAFALLVLSENNAQAQKFNDLQAAIAAATSLADLKTRAAAVGNMPIRTAAQLKNAMRNNL